MLTALVVDDEPRAVARLAAMLEQSGCVEVIGTASSVDDAERFLAGRRPDCVFLDIDMPDRLGPDLVASLSPETRHVFVTAYEGHAISAFHKGALDYILKPFDADRLAVTLERLRDACGLPEIATAPDPGGSLEDALTVQLAVGGDRGVVLVPLADVVWIEACQNYTRVQAIGHPPGMIRRTLGTWQELLHTVGGFERLDRSLVIRLAALRSRVWKSRDQTLLYFTGVDKPIPIGRAAASRLRQLLDGQAGG
jgi:DNA-binding LytR/AlgR family response regulator